MFALSCDIFRVPLSFFLQHSGTALLRVDGYTIDA